MQLTSVILIGLLSLTSAVTFHHLSDGIVATCQPQIQQCLKDTECWPALDCYAQANCQFNDTECFKTCFEPVIYNEAFWEMDLCGMNVAITMEGAEKDPIQDCHFDECGRYIFECYEDDVCVEANVCQQECEKNQETYMSCAAACLAKYVDNKPMYNMVKCDHRCLSKYITN